MRLRTGPRDLHVVGRPTSPRTAVTARASHRPGSRSPGRPGSGRSWRVVGNHRPGKAQKSSSLQLDVGLRAAERPADHVPVHLSPPRLPMKWHGGLVPGQDVIGGVHHVGGGGRHAVEQVPDARRDLAARPGGCGGASPAVRNRYSRSSPLSTVPAQARRAPAATAAARGPARAGCSSRRTCPRAVRPPGGAARACGACRSRAARRPAASAGPASPAGTPRGPPRFTVVMTQACHRRARSTAAQGGTAGPSLGRSLPVRRHPS